MFAIVLSALIVIVLFVVLGFGKSGTGKVWKLRPRQILSLLGAAFLLTG